MSEGERFMREQKWADATPLQRLWGVAWPIGATVLVLLFLAEIVYG
jgi:hypothetical protein